MSYIGVDLRTNSSTVCRLDSDGSDLFTAWGLRRFDLERFCLTLDVDNEIAVESTGNSAWFCDEVVSCVGRVMLVNSRRFQVIWGLFSKAERKDALALALSKDMLPESRVKSVAESALASLRRTRDFLVKQRTWLINNIHALHVRHGIELKCAGLSLKRQLAGLKIGRFTALEEVELRVLWDRALTLIEAIAGLDGEITAAAMPGYENLILVKRIGPRVSQSNGTDNYERISKRGNKSMRRTLVQCTLIAIFYSGYLNDFYRRIRERGGAGKTIIATARKLLAIIYDMFWNGSVFEDFTVLKLANNTNSSRQSP